MMKNMYLDDFYYLLVLILPLLSPQWLVLGFAPLRPGFEPGTSHVGFVVDNAALG
jgi:hypothetical protein